MLALADDELVELSVSSHVLTELASSADRYGSSSYDLARRASVLPCYPTGSIKELAGTIQGLAGTIGEISQTDEFRMKLGSIAKEGTSLRDRGALIDSIRAGMDWFVSLDKGIVGAGPKDRIKNILNFNVGQPSEIVATLAEPNGA